MDLRIARKLLTFNATLTEHVEVNEVLRRVVQAASDIIDQSEVLILYLYDEQSNRLKFSYGVGVDEEALALIEFAPGESIVGKIFVEQKPKLFRSESEIDLFMQNMRKVNFDYYYKGVYKRKIKSTFGVPVVSKGRCYGVIIVNNFSEENAFSKDHMEVIEIIADHSAIALDNSSLYHHMKEKNELLSQSVNIHNRFYQLMLEGKGIEEVILLLERLIKVPVQLVSEKKNADELYYPIIRNKELLGYLFMGQSFPSFSKMDQIAIEQASFSIALEQMKQNELFEREIQFRGEMFQRLIENVSFKEWERMVQHLQWDVKGKICCMILEGKETPLWNPLIRYERERVVRNIEAICMELNMTNLAVTKRKQLILLVPEMNSHLIRQFIGEVSNRLEGCKQVVVGIGRYVSLEEIGVTYEEAMEALLFTHQHKETIIFYEQLGFERLLSGMEEQVLNRFVNDKLRKLIELGDVYIHTLQRYMIENKRHKETATKLHIHENTLYMRLRKIEEVLQVNLNQTNDWLNIVIALTVYVPRDK